MLYQQGTGPTGSFFEWHLHFQLARLDCFQVVSLPCLLVLELMSSTQRHFPLADGWRRCGHDERSLIGRRQGPLME